MAASNPSSTLTRPKALVLSAVALLSLCSVTPGTGQIPRQTPQQGIPPASSRTPFPDGTAASPDPLAGLNTAKLEHMREDERHKRLLADTAKLVALSNELNAEVEKTSKDELSVEVVRKAAEIEKLAHDVKERMKS